MEKEQRNVLRRAVEQARKLLEREISEQLEGVYGILPDGRILDAAPGDPIVRERLREVVSHHQASGMSAKQAVDRTVREMAFTTLNRFAGLKMAERRGLVRECISKGLESEGMRELIDCAPGVRAACDDGGFRLLLETIMDELSLGLSVLFDRRSPTGLIWPRPVALDGLLTILNATQLAALWAEDETIGWIYQYFHPKEEREAMREESATPRNSYELAVRNQFFTPRYVVEFLADNTLGRMWYEMRKGNTALKDRCRYLVYRQNDVFLRTHEQAPMGAGDGVRTAIEHRPIKDPRDLRILDPACGSGHFLLYCFGLLQAIYEEAWADEAQPVHEITGTTLRQDYPTIEALRRKVPVLILKHNLYGIEIDPRAAQIAALALWLRAQRAYGELDLKPAERPKVERTNIVVAEPMPGEGELREELTKSMHPRLLGQIIEGVFEKMCLAGDIGSLLKIETEIANTLKKTKEVWLAAPREDQLCLFPSQAAKKSKPDLSGITDDTFWQQAEGLIYQALQDYAARASNGAGFRRSLFAHDAEQGFAFIDVCRQSYDVVLMNPPFGAAAERGKRYIDETYPRTKNDLYAAFVERGLEWLHPRGMLGAITSRTGFFLGSFQRWREEILLKEARPAVVADLGYGVLDTAMVETAAYVLEHAQTAAA